MAVAPDDLRRLYEQLGPPLLAYARSIQRDLAEAEDAVHQVFLNLMRPEAVLPHEPRPYLFRAVRNACLNRRRTTARDTDAEERRAFLAPDGLDGLTVDLERALDALPADQREVVVLRVWGEMTLDECARLLEIPLNTVASRYRYGLAKLRQRFGAHLES